MTEGQQFVEQLRELATYVKQGHALTPELVEYLEGTQDALASLYEKYGEEPAEGGEMITELMSEALKLVHDGIDELLVYTENDGSEEDLTSALAKMEEGNDVLASVRFAIEQDTSWTAGTSLG